MAGPLDGLFPSFVRIHYTTQFAPHVMTIPTRQVVYTTPGDVPSYTGWSEAPVTAVIMVEALVTAMLPNVLPSTVFDSYEVFDVPELEQPPKWIFASQLSGQIGTLVNTGTAKAVQYTLGFKTSLSGLARLVFLDCPNGNVFGNEFGPQARNADVINEFQNEDMAWQGRDGGKPIFFSNTSVSLNKRLRRSYHMI